MTNDFGVRDAKFDSIQEIENQMILNFWSKTDRHHFGFNGSFSLGFGIDSPINNFQLAGPEYIPLFETRTMSQDFLVT